MFHFLEGCLFFLSVSVVLSSSKSNMNVCSAFLVI